MGASSDSINEESVIGSRNGGDPEPVTQQTRYPSGVDPERRPLLSPDDPSVSPLNVKNVRISKAILGLSSVISLFWIIFLIVSDFISIPGFNNHGRSFLEFNLVLLTLLNSLVSQLFFTVPSNIDRVIGYSTAGIIGFDLFLVLVVPGLRYDEYMVGIWTFVWTLFASVFGSFADYLVEQGKIHEEIRLTGRPETRKSFYEYSVIMVRNVLRCVLLILFVLISLNIWLDAFDSRIAPWGEKVGVEDNSFGIHISCYGDVYLNETSRDLDPQPILLLEAGQWDSSEDYASWVDELYQLNKIERYCIYDRPGSGFSDSSPSPLSIGITIDLLNEVLKKKEIHGPFMLVGFDVGGLYSRVFASRYLSQVHSLILVDSWPENMLKRDPFSTPNGSKDKWEDLYRTIHIRPTNTRQGLRLWLHAFISPYQLISWKNVLVKRHGSRERIFGEDMIHRGKFLRSKLQEHMASGILSYNEVYNSNLMLNNVPLGVISSDLMIKNSINWGKWQRGLTKISGNSLEWTIADGGHKIWENPKGKVQLQNFILRMLGSDDKVVMVEVE